MVLKMLQDEFEAPSPPYDLSYYIATPHIRIGLKRLGFHAITGCQTPMEDDP